MPALPPFCDFKNRQGLSLGVSSSGKYYLVDTRTSENIELDRYIDTCCATGEDCFKLSVLYSEHRGTTKPISSKDMCLDYSFNTENYSPDLQLAILPEYIEPDTAVISESHVTVSEDKQEYSYPISISDSVTTIAASIAMVMAVMQNARAKKRELESAKCCSDSKINIEKLDSKISDLDKRLDSIREKDNKAIHAEMYEHYKELKELKEDSENLKDILQKVVERLKA
jgi:hypothetical protein